MVSKVPPYETEGPQAVNARLECIEEAFRRGLDRLIALEKRMHAVEMERFAEPLTPDVPPAPSWVPKEWLPTPYVGDTTPPYVGDTIPNPWVVTAAEGTAVKYGLGEFATTPPSGKKAP